MFDIFSIMSIFLSYIFTGLRMVEQFYTDCLKLVTKIICKISDLGQEHTECGGVKHVCWQKIHYIYHLKLKS